MKKHLYMMILMSVIQAVIAIIGNFVMIIVSPVYLIGILFWDNEQGKRMVDTFDEAVAKL